MYVRPQSKDNTIWSDTELHTINIYFTCEDFILCICVTKYGHNNCIRVFYCLQKSRNIRVLYLCTFARLQ